MEKYIKFNGSVVYRSVRPGVYEVNDTYSWIEYNQSHDTPLPHKFVFKGQIISALREKMGLSISELARRTGIDKSVLSRIESRFDYNVSEKNIQRIAKALECSPLYLTGDIDELNPTMDFQAADPLEKEIIDAYKNADSKTQTIILMLLDIKKPGEENDAKDYLYANGKKIYIKK